MRRSGSGAVGLSGWGRRPGGRCPGPGGERAGALPRRVASLRLRGLSVPLWKGPFNGGESPQGRSEGQGPGALSWAGPGGSDTAFPALSCFPAGLGPA